jgi:hypothetical protein
MDPNLKFDYDPVGDILYIRTVAPHARQVKDQVEYNVVVRRNPDTQAVEGVDVLFFTRWLLKHGQPQANNLTDLFTRSAA